MLSDFTRYSANLLQTPLQTRNKKKLGGVRTILLTKKKTMRRRKTMTRKKMMKTRKMMMTLIAPQHQTFLAPLLRRSLLKPQNQP